MERNRELRRASIVSSNGFNRRSHRTNMFRDSPDEGGGVELQESVRLRDRTKKDREREIDRERRGREKKLRERSNRSKRRRGQRLTSNRDDIGGDEFSDESLIDDEYEDDDDATATILIPAAAISDQSLHSSLIQQCSSNNSNSVSRSNHHLQHRKGFPPASSSSSSKVFTAAPIWKPDEIINVSVPRKARSSSTKRSHDRTSTSSNNYSGGEKQVQGGVSTSTPSPAAPMSPPSSSNAPFRKKLKSSGESGGQKVKPPKAAVKQSSSNPEELEIEIAEVLYGLMSQTPVPSSKKEDSREVDRSNDPVQPVAPKRKRPGDIQENSSHSGSAKLDMDKKTKSEISSPDLEKNSASNGENVCDIGGISSSQGPEPMASTSVKMNLVLRESGDSAVKKDVSLPKEKKSTVMRNENLICMDTALTATASAVMINANALASDVENQRQQKLEIDLMAPPPQVRSSPEGGIKIHFKATTTAADQKSSLSISNVPDALKDKVEKRMIAKEQSESADVEESKEKWTVQEAGLKKEIENKGRSVVDVQLDLEKPVGNGNAAVNSSGNKLQLYNNKQQQQEMSFKANREDPLPEKSSQSKSSMPLPVPMASWPGGLPPLGYMAPLQGVVSMDGSAVGPAPILPLFSQPRPKRCATHSFIARSIHGLQQVMKMNPFWHVAAGSASLFGSKPGNHNLMHADLHGNMATRGINNALDKVNDLASNPNRTGRDKGPQTASTSDSGHRKQPILIQQSLSPIPATNLLGPAFIIPLNQQQAAAAAVSARPSSSKSASVRGSTATSDPSATAAVVPAMSFNYPAMAANETQYLAILQNNAYPFPIPAVGAPPNYRGNPVLFNGSFYSSQMIHPSQLQHLQTPSVQSPQLQQVHSNSSSSQRPLLSLQPRPQSIGANDVNSQDSPGPKSQPSQQSQQSNNPHPPAPRARHFDDEVGSEGSPATTDRKGTRGSVNIYGQNFAMPIHPHNFALMTPPTALTGASPAIGSTNQSEKQQQQSLAHHGFAMSFGTINGTNTSPTSMTQNHAILQSFPPTAAVAQAAQKHFRESADDKSGGVGDSVSGDPERKRSITKAEVGVGQSITFSRSDSVNAPVSSAQANCVNVIESSGQSPDVTSGAARSSQPGITSSVSAINAPINHFQGLLQQKQLATTAVNRSKAPGASNGSLFSDHLNSSSIMAAKYPTGFPQNFVQSSTSTSQYTQWRSSTKTLASESPSALASSGVATTKDLSQQTQISFGGNQKPSSSQGQASPSSNQVPSPTASSISRGGSGSSRTTTSASSNTKTGQNSVPNQKLPSVLGKPHVTSSSSGAKHPQQQHTMQQTQLFFSNPYSQSTTSSPGGFYMHRKRADQQQQPLVVPPTGILTSSSTTMNDPAKAIAAATANVKGGGLASQGMILPATFSYPHPVPAAVQVKPAEQKQPAG